MTTLSWSQSIFLGVVQGVTEFLPISSSGHLNLFQNILNLQQMPLAMDVFLHLGTLGSIFVYFRTDLRNLIENFLSKGKESQEAFRFFFLIFIALIPTALIGLFLKPTVEVMGNSYRSVGIGFLITTFLLLLGSKGFYHSKNNKTVFPFWHALLIGTIQGISVWPGISRSGATIAVALLLGWSWKDAGRFSFFIAIPAIAGATLLTAKDLNSIPLFVTFLGMLAAFLTGWICLRLLMKFLELKKLALCSLLFFTSGLFPDSVKLIP